MGDFGHTVHTVVSSGSKLANAAFSMSTTPFPEKACRLCLSFIPSDESPNEKEHENEEVAKKPKCESVDISHEICFGCKRMLSGSSSEIWGLVSML